MSGREEFDMDIGYITDCGNVRAENQDRLLVLERRGDSEEITLCAVADGMGGTENGSLASALTVRRLHVWWQEELPGLLANQAIHAYASQSLELLIQECNREILRQAESFGISTGTTLSLMFAYKGQALVKHVGDSRIYLERNGQWIQITKDHTWEQQEIDRGVDPRTDAGYESKKGALVNALGACENCWVDTQVLQMAEGDRYLICSDGFYRYIDPQQQMQDCTRAQELLEEMAGKIRNTPAVDNFTAVLAINEALKRSLHETRTIRLF